MSCTSENKLEWLLRDSPGQPSRFPAELGGLDGLMSSRAHRRVNRSVPLMSLGSLPATYRSTLASSQRIQRPLAAFEGLSATITRNGFYAVQSTARSFHAGAAQGLKEQQQGWWMESLCAMSRSSKESRSLRWEWCPGGSGAQQPTEVER
jgi:hypothetical protein